MPKPEAAHGALSCGTCRTVPLLGHPLTAGGICGRQSIGGTPHTKNSGTAHPANTLANRSIPHRYDGSHVTQVYLALTVFPHPTWPP